MKGHRTYLDPNPRLVSARGTTWIPPRREGHREFIEPKLPKKAAA